MFAHDQYELIDFGGGRKLERFGQYVVDRPAPAADREKPASGRHAWQAAGACFQRDREKRWVCRDAPSENWTIRHGNAVFGLKLAESGQVGLFAEQSENWEWIAKCTAAAERPLKVLNLFAYTGGSTLAAAAAGAQVVHVDASQSAVSWARRNAEFSGLADAPIRWIVEDARRFARREVRRGNTYDAIVLDPPSYGHGPQGQAWRLEKHLPELLADCAELTAASRAFMLLTCHTTGVGPDEVQALLADCLPAEKRRGVDVGRLAIKATDGRKLFSGVFARWSK